MENMKRINKLTEKNKYDIYCPKKKVSILDLSAKLGKFEDLEEELGCPLKVVFKALISGIIVRNDEDLIEIGYSDREDKYVNFSTEEIYLKNWQSHGIEKTTNCFQITFGDDGEWCVYLDDYKKTWWLPSDKEWKDER